MLNVHPTKNFRTCQRFHRDGYRLTEQSVRDSVEQVENFILLQIKTIKQLVEVFHVALVFWKDGNLNRKCRFPLLYMKATRFSLSLSE